MRSFRAIVLEVARRQARGAANRMASAEALFVCCAVLVAGMVCYAAAFRNGSENAPVAASTFGALYAQHRDGARSGPWPGQAARAQRTPHRVGQAQARPVQVANRAIQMASLDSPPRAAAPWGVQARQPGSKGGRSRTHGGDPQRAGLTGRGVPHLDLRPAGAVGDQPPNPPTATRTPSPSATATPTMTATPTASATPVPPPTDTPVPVAAGTNATVWVTGYTLSGTTATGGQAGPGVCAVDPSYIPLGTQITIDGIGSCVAADTGPGVVGGHIDVWVPSYDIALGITGWYQAHW